MKDFFLFRKSLKDLRAIQKIRIHKVLTLSTLAENFICESIKSKHRDQLNSLFNASLPIGVFCLFFAYPQIKILRAWVTLKTGDKNYNLQMVQAVQDLVDNGGVSLSNLQIVGYNLNGIVLKARNFSDLKLNNSSLINSELKLIYSFNSDFTNGIFTNADFSGSDLRNTKLTSANLINANFKFTY